MRADKDGDLTMDIAVKGRGRIGKAPPTGPSRDLSSRVGRSDARSSVLSKTAQSAILRRAAAGDIAMKEHKSAAPRGGLVELKITGWEKSKASATAADGGVSSLIKWLERKATHRLGSRARDVKVKKVCCRQRLADRNHSLNMLATISGPPSFAANFRTTTAIGAFG